MICHVYKIYNRQKTMSEIYVFIILFLSPGLQSGLNIKPFKLVFMQNQVSHDRPK